MMRHNVQCELALAEAFLIDLSVFSGDSLSLIKHPVSSEKASNTLMTPSGLRVSMGVGGHRLLIRMLDCSGRNSVKKLTTKAYKEIISNTS
ncbi:hypothetical protein EVAR_41428_1 [Eumeta japonica]|uniref:Uncharacterized protein n=1 Tax=Eumeta variegata TaxID=151549 RepID=A0A4C1W7G0_EUMVA|nr:hypothetical protein EVAR_41428_1 [Eumeta japonica]